MKCSMYSHNQKFMDQGNGNFSSYSSPTNFRMNARCRISTELMKTTTHSSPGCCAAEQKLEIAAFMVRKLLLLSVHEAAFIFVVPTRKLSMSCSTN